MRQRQTSNRILVATLLMLTTAGPAVAHHPTGGKAPETLFHGLLSGFGHPVIGLDHLAFIIALGIAAALLPSGLTVVVAFVAASTAGVIAHVLSVGIPASEVVVALSVVIAGIAIVFHQGFGRPQWILLSILAGFFHGYAFGEAVVGSERQVVGAYLIGLAVMMSVIALAVREFTKRFVLPGDMAGGRLRTAGIAMGCIGIVLLTGGLVGG
jgi:urease accessory protein